MMQKYKLKIEPIVAISLKNYTKFPFFALFYRVYNTFVCQKCVSYDKKEINSPYRARGFKDKRTRHTRSRQRQVDACL